MKDKIRVDRREPAWIIIELQKLNAPMEKPETLIIGDFVTDKVAVERKGAHDYVASLIDKRLFDQGNRLYVHCKENDKAGMFFVHGDLEQAIDSANDRIEKRTIALRNAKSKLMLKQGKSKSAIREAIKKIKFRRITRKAVYGSMASLMVRYFPYVTVQYCGIPLKDREWTAYVLFRLIEKIHEEKLGKPRKVFKRRR